MQDLKQLTNQVEAIVKEVGDWVLFEQKNAKREVEKEKGDYATNIDLEAERRLVDALRELDPSIGFKTEEKTANSNPGSSPGQIANSCYSWVIDPIDGTKNFFRKLPLWSVNVALFDSEAKEVLLGVVYFPKLRDMFRAYKGGGAYRNGNLCKPSEVSDPKEAICYMELPSGAAERTGDDTLNNLLKKYYRVRGWGLASALCYLADGSFDIHVDLSGTTKPFDIYAPLVVAREAGCEVYGEPPNYLVVTNSSLDLDWLDE